MEERNKDREDGAGRVATGAGSRAGSVGAGERERRKRARRGRGRREESTESLRLRLAPGALSLARKSGKRSRNKPPSRSLIFSFPFIFARLSVPKCARLPFAASLSPTARPLRCALQPPHGTSAWHPPVSLLPFPRPPAGLRIHAPQIRHRLLDAAISPDR